MSKLLIQNVKQQMWRLRKCTIHTVQLARAIATAPTLSNTLDFLYAHTKQGNIFSNFQQRQRLTTTATTMGILRILPFVLLISKTPVNAVTPFNQHQLIKRSFSATQAKASSCNKMPEQRTAPVISTQEEFELKMPGFLSTNKTLALLMDYDGTLAPIADNPNKTHMTVEMEVLLNKVAKLPNIFMAVISGRGLSDVQSRVGIKGITYGGNHGLEIESGDGTRHDYALPAEVQQSYKKLVKELTDKVNKNNAWVEDKRVSLTYHYRDTPRDVCEEQKQLAISIIESHGFRANQAHEAIEAKPPVNWNKGEAALLILKNKFGENWAENVKVIFAGDDTTDEDAMRLLQGAGRTFRVSLDPEIQTYADFRLARQDVVQDLLKWIGSVYSTA